MIGSDTTRSRTKSNTSSEDSSQKNYTGESSWTSLSNANSQIIGGEQENLTATTGTPAETSEEILRLLTQNNVVGKASSGSQANPAMKKSHLPDAVIHMLSDRLVPAGTQANITQRNQATIMGLAIRLIPAVQGTQGGPTLSAPKQANAPLALGQMRPHAASTNTPLVPPNMLVQQAFLRTLLGQISDEMQSYLTFPNRMDALVQQLHQSATQMPQPLLNQFLASSMGPNQTSIPPSFGPIGPSIVNNSATEGEPRAKRRRVEEASSKILAIPEDIDNLSAHQIFLRYQIEAFRATKDHVSTHTRGRNKPVTVGQVGIRCRHCSHISIGNGQKGSTYFPATLLGLYQAAQNMCTIHMQCGLCSEMPLEIKQQFAQLLSTKVAGTGAGRPYWASAAILHGLVDTDDGIRFSGDLKHQIPEDTKQAWG